MKSAIEEHGIAIQVCRWWEITIESPSNIPAVMNWLYGAGCLHPDQPVGQELWFLSQTLYERKMLP